MPDSLRSIARRHLDVDLARARDTTPARPAAGWIRTIRSALGMGVTDLARRMGTTDASVHALERSERAGTIKLATLERAAQAMGCRVLVTIVPESTLDGFVDARSRSVASRELEVVDHMMVLEGQAVVDGDNANIIDARMRELKESSRLWSER